MRDSRRWAVKYGVDILVWTLVAPVAFWIRLEGAWLSNTTEILVYTAVGLALKAALVFGLKLYRRSWQKLGFRDLFVLIEGVGLTVALLLVFAHFRPIVPEQWEIPRSVPLIEGMLALLGLSFVRMITRVHFERRGLVATKGTRKQVLIAGAGEAGTMIAREMMRHPEAGLSPVGFVDDNLGKQRKLFVGLDVLGTLQDLPEIIKQKSIDEVVIAMPSESGDVVRRILGYLKGVKVAYRIIPGMYEIISGQVAISQIREVDVADLLRRAPVELDKSGIEEYIGGKVVLVTGAGGSIGSEIVRQVTDYRTREVILLGRGENSIFEISSEVRRKWPNITWHTVIADIRDRNRLEKVFARFRPDVVFHAAAHKHVPLMEDNVVEAVINNISGTRNLLACALESGVSRFVNISTDKAVRPTSVMGASKRVAEYLVDWAGRLAGESQSFVSVRFGNVLGSRGSVVEIFKGQIKRGGPVTVTDENMKRYFMTIPEAVQLVLQAGSQGRNGSVYVLDMGDPLKIVDLARDLITLCGYSPGVDIQIEFSGRRPGEKLFEELLTSEEGTVATKHKKIFIARKVGISDEKLIPLVDEIVAEARNGQDEVYIRHLLTELIPTNMFAEIPNSTPVLQ